MILVAFLVLCAVLVPIVRWAYLHDYGCTKGGIHDFVLVLFREWAFGKYEADWECEKCGVTSHRFGITSHEAARWFKDWRKVRDQIGDYRWLGQEELKGLLK